VSLVEGSGGGLRIAMLGTRGVPASYGGFETAVEEIGSRLVRRGHRVLVYNRLDERTTDLQWHRGMRTVPLPALQKKSAETLSRTALSAVHSAGYAKPDMAFVFNAANAPLLPMLRAAGIPVATHVDGLEWRRAKWGPTGRRYYLAAERLSVRWSDALIADAPGIASYYRSQYDADTDLLTYGAPVLQDLSSEGLPSGLLPKKYHLAVARFEPENHILEIVQGYVASSATMPLVVVGDAPFAQAYTKAVRDVADADPRVQCIGRVNDQAVLDQLYAHALTYVHGHSVGGTNPSLLRAMGAGTAVLAFDVNFNREVAGDHGRYFADPAALARLFDEVETEPQVLLDSGQALQSLAQERYDWDDVTDGYEALARRLVASRR
jgi:glycosyltransferase involved in cell wall biosynthesis